MVWSATVTLLEAPEPADPVVHVDHVVARLELAQALDGAAAPEPTPAAHAAGAAEDLVVGEHAERGLALRG
jgi:hypothetical protein